MFILNMEKYLNDEAKICTTNLREPGGKWTYIALFYSEPITSHFTHLHKYSDSTFLLSHTPMDPSAVIWSLAFFPLMLQLEDWRSQPSSTRHLQLRLQTALHTHFQTGFSSIGPAWCPRGRILLKCHLGHMPLTVTTAGWLTCGSKPFVRCSQSEEFWLKVNDKLQEQGSK